MKGSKIFLVAILISMFIACGDDDGPTAPNGNGNGDNGDNGTTPTTEYRLYYIKDFDLYAYDVGNDSIAQITVGSQVGDLAVASEEKYVAFTDNYQLKLYDPSTGDIISLVTTGESKSPSFFPSADSLAYILRESPSSFLIKIVDVSTHESRQLLSRVDHTRELQVSPNGKYFTFLGPVFPGALHIIHLADMTEIDFVPSLPTDIDAYIWQDENNIMLASGGNICNARVEQRNWETYITGGRHPIAANDSLFVYTKNSDLYLKTETTQELIYTPEGSLRKVDISPSGNYVAMLEYSSGNYSLNVYSIPDDSLRVIESGEEWIYTLDW